MRVQPSRMRLKVRRNGFELSDSLFLTGSRINTEFSLGAPGENGFELSSTGSRTSTEIAVTDFLRVRREERLGEIGRQNLIGARKRSRSCVSWDSRPIVASLSPGDVTDDEDIAVAPAE